MTSPLGRRGRLTEAVASLTRQGHPQGGDSTAVHGRRALPGRQCPGTPQPPSPAVSCDAPSCEKHHVALRGVCRSRGRGPGGTVRCSLFRPPVPLHAAEAGQDVRSLHLPRCRSPPRVTAPPLRPEPGVHRGAQGPLPSRVLAAVRLTVQREPRCAGSVFPAPSKPPPPPPGAAR